MGDLFVSRWTAGKAAVFGVVLLAMRLLLTIKGRGENSKDFLGL
jgi:hypothetical protein